MSSSRDLAADVDIDIAGLFQEVWRRRYVLAILVLASAVGFFVLLSGIEPRYRSDARIIIEKRESIFTRREEGGSDRGTVFDEEGVGSQVQVIGSDELALNVIESLQLAQHPDFRGEAKTSLLSDILAVIGLSDPEQGPSSNEKILNSFRERLSVYAPEKSRVVVIEFWSHDPDLARSVPNALAETYIEFNRQAKLRSTEEATEWLGPEIDELRDKLREAEEKVAEFRASSDILIGANNALLATQQLTEAASELSRIRAERSAAEGKVDAIQAALRSGGSLDVIPEVIASPLIQRLREREVQLHAQISELSTSLLPDHPRLRALQSQRADFSRQIRTAASDILMSLRNNVDLFARQEAVLVKRVNALKSEAARVGEAEVELRALEREATAQRQLLETYLTQYREAASRQNRGYLPVDARIISRAVLPTKPYFPKVLPFTVAGTVTVAILAVFFILAWALMTGRAFRPAGRVPGSMMPEQLGTDRPADPELAAGDPAEVPVAQADPPAEAEIIELDEREGVATSHSVEPDSAPHSVAEEEVVPAPMPQSAANQATFPFRYVFEAVCGLGNARVAVISPGGDMGSILAWHFARSIAASGKRSIIVDLTGSAVTSRKFLGSDHFCGLRDVIAGDCDFSKAIYRDRFSPLHVLPAGDPEAQSPADAFERLTAIVDSLESEYSFIIFDCGFAEPDSLASIAESQTLVFISQEGSSEEETLAQEQRFRQAGYDDAVIVHLEQPDRQKALADAA